MTQRRPVAPAVATMLALTLIPTAFAWAAPNSLPANSPALSHSPQDSEASQEGDGPDLSLAVASPTQTPVRRYHRKAVRHAAKAAPKPLPSRGGSFGAGGANVVGRVAVVLADNTPIHAGRDRYQRVLSVVPRGQTLAISGETPTEYAVLMIDRSLGYLPKNAVQILTNLQAVSDTPSINTIGLRMVQAAEGYLGVPYVWGGNTRAGIDCSGFVRAVYAANGIGLPRVSGDQATVGYDVPHNVGAGDWTQWAPGDRMYFACHHPRIDHTGMYIGNGLFIHASVGHNNQVAIDRVDNAYYSGHLVAVRRSQELLGEPAMPGDAASQAASGSYPTNYPSLDPEANQEH